MVRHGRCQLAAGKEVANRLLKNQSEMAKRQILELRTPNVNRQPNPQIIIHVPNFISATLFLDVATFAHRSA